MSEPISSGGAVSAASAKVAHWFAGLAPFVGAITAQWFGALVGAAIGLATYLTALHFQRKRDKREQAAFDAQMAALRGKQ